MCDVVVWVLVNEEGDYVATADDPEKLKAIWEEDIGELGTTDATRLIKVTLKVPTPKPLVMSGTVADEPNAGELAAV